MITTELDRWDFRAGEVYRKFHGECLSTDTKPTTGVINGSKLHEMDTGKDYYFDETNTTWREQPAASGGSGGGNDVFWVDTQSSNDEIVLNKTYTEIKAAFDAGKLVVIRDEEIMSGMAVGLYLPAAIGAANGNYIVSIVSAAKTVSFVSLSADGVLAYNDK